MKLKIQRRSDCPAASPPSRGAWIEMIGSYSAVMARYCRPPRGGRGLKYLMSGGGVQESPVAPLAGGVD